MPPPEDLENLIYRLGKRGFKRDDLQLHDCTGCGEHAVLTFVIMGRAGGRDIQICQACGLSTSYRSNAGLHERVQDLDFDLRAFLA